MKWCGTYETGEKPKHVQMMVMTNLILRYFKHLEECDGGSTASSIGCFFVAVSKDGVYMLLMEKLNGKHDDSG